MYAIDKKEEKNGVKFTMIVLSGAAGFIGSNILKELNENNLNKIIIVDNIKESIKWKNLVGKQFLDYYHKEEFLQKLENNKLNFVPKAIIHMGACSSTTESDFDYLMENNFHYSIKLFQWAKKNKARFIYASSAATYGNGENGFEDDHNKINNLRPINKYGFSKQLFDMWILANHLENEVVGLKFFNVFGPNENHKDSMMSLVQKAYYQIKEKGFVNLFKSYDKNYQDGCQKRDFVYVKDCSKIILELIFEEKIQGIFNLGSAKACTWLELINAVFSSMGLKANINFIDMPCNLKNSYQYYTKANMRKLEQCYKEIFAKKLNFTSLKDAVDDYINNYLAKDKLR